MKIARQSKRWTDAIDTVERLESLVEGDKKQHKDPVARDGLIGRIETLEGILPATTKSVSRVDKQIKAVLRGMGVPSDYSDEHVLEQAIKQRLQAAGVHVQRLDAQHALQQQQRAGRRDSDYERGEHERISTLPGLKPYVQEDPFSSLPPPALKGKPGRSTSWRNHPPDSNPDSDDKDNDEE